MSTTSIKSGIRAPVLPTSRVEAASVGGPMGRELTLGAGRSRAGWQRPLVETLVVLAVIVLLQRRFIGMAEILGLPHPYWLPVLLASCQYGLRGGMIATVTASVVYWIGLAPPSASQDFYAYAGMVAVQPGAWLATALIVGGLRNLHIYQATELADELAASRERANDLGGGLKRATAEIDALERRIAIDMRSVAAFSRSLSFMDLKDRRAAAMSYGELFRVGTGLATFTIYLKDQSNYVPVLDMEEGASRPTKSMESLALTTIEAMLTGNAVRGSADDAQAGKSDTRRHVVSVPPSSVESRALAVIICNLQTLQEPDQFPRRADELSRALATILQACPDATSGRVL